MNLITSRFGNVKVEEDQAVLFDEGPVGFAESRRFYIVPQDPGIPLRWLQDADDPSLAFVIIDPGHFRLDYQPMLAREDMECLGLKSLEDAEVHALVVIPEDPQGMTANLKAPIIVNKRTRRARQVILDNPEYGIRHRVLEEFRQSAEKRMKTRVIKGRSVCQGGT